MVAKNSFVAEVTFKLKLVDILHVNITWVIHLILAI